jgi:hypothetical protein
MFPPLETLYRSDGVGVAYQALAALLTAVV